MSEKEIEHPRKNNRKDRSRRHSLETTQPTITPFNDVGCCELARGGSAMHNNLELSGVNALI